MSITVQQDATIYSFIIFLQTALHVSDDTLIHHQEHTQTVITASGIIRTILAIFRCNYSLYVLLMMGEVISRNM